MAVGVPVNVWLPCWLVRGMLSLEALCGIAIAHHLEVVLVNG